LVKSKRSYHEQSPHRIAGYRGPGLRGIPGFGSSDRGGSARQPCPLLQGPECRKRQGEAPELIKQSTTPEWVTCRGNDLCNTRDEVMAGVGQRLKTIPDLKWEIKEILVNGNRVIVRGEATGTPAGELMGRQPTASHSNLCRSMFIPSKAARSPRPTMSRTGRARSFRQIAQK
jgi:hypothetical protein